MAGFGVADVLLFDGAFQQGAAKLDAITLPPTTADTAGLSGLVMADHATAAMLDARHGDATAAMEAAAELAERFGVVGDVDSLGFVFTPTDAGMFRMWHTLEMGEPDQTVSIAQGMHPERQPFPSIQVNYWVNYSRALAQLRDRRDDAVRALRTAEDIFPTKVRRDSLVREVIAMRLPGARRDGIGMELRGMAYRAGLPV